MSKAKMPDTEAMDWVAIATACFALANAITKTTVDLNAFIRDVRESRSDLDGLSGELHSLEGVLDLLKDDASSFPPELATRTPTVLQHCTAVVNELEGYVSILNSPGLSRQSKRLRWLATKSHMARLRSTLDGYKLTLGLAADLVAFTAIRGDKESESELESTDAESDNLEARNNISQTLSKMVQLSNRLHEDVQKSAALRSYLDALQAYAEDEGIKLDLEISEKAGAGSPTAGSFSDAPDSAIEITEDESYFKETHGPAQTKTQGSAIMPVSEIDELLDELRDMPASPPVPPRNIRRNSSMSSNKSNTTPTPSYRAPAALPTNVDLGLPNSILPNQYQCVTKITAGPIVAAQPPVKRGLISRMFSTKKPSHTQTVASGAASIRTVDSRPSTASMASDSTKTIELGRRGSVSKRLSRSFPMFKVEEEDPIPLAAEPNAIFGVSLAKSIQVAQSTARTHHTNDAAGGKTGRSRREFPLCVYKCTQFMAQLDAAKAPEIFGEPGDPARLAALRDLFSTGPTYGDDVDWDWFTVYEAADLILAYLSELPKPLVGEAVAKRWISLSRQATITTGTRTDQCIDFWEEALLGLRGPARNLLKLLLNLWADVAEAADENGMTAERLAAKVLQPLMHSSAKTYTTDYMLSLAFLIRKRAEYLALLQGKGKGKSKAAF